MRHRRSVLSALVIAGVLAGSSYGQQPDRRRGNTGEPAEQEKAGLDRKAAVGHALCMAIEGSGLWECAKKSSAMAGGGNANQPGANAPATSAAQGPRPLASELQRHAQEAFAASKKLFTAVKDEKQRTQSPGQPQDSKSSEACERFYRAAQAYSQTLESLCRQNRDENLRQASTTPREGGAGNSSGEDGARIALINHAVKEAVGGVALRGMLEKHGKHAGTAQVLKTHADEMIASSKQAIDSASVGRQDRTGRDTRGTERSQSPRESREPASIQTLTRQGREVIQAVQQLEESHSNERTSQK